VDILPWANLYKFYKHKNYSPAEDHRAFRAWTGIHPSVAEKIFTKYQHPCLPDRTRLLIVLHFLKDMPSEEEGSSRFQLTRNTYRKYLWSSIEYLDYKMDEIDIEDRYFQQLLLFSLLI
jgi:Mg2+ and Co2+ transporter CorA